MPESKSGALTNLATPLLSLERGAFKRGADFTQCLGERPPFLLKIGEWVFGQAVGNPADDAGWQSALCLFCGDTA